MVQPLRYHDISDQLLNSMKDYANEFSEYCALLLIRITPVVRQAFANATVAMGTALPRQIFSQIKFSTRMGNRLNGQNHEGVCPSYWEEWKSVRETARVLCSACNGKGVISNACRCHGKGKVLDKKETEMQGVPVMKVCERCTGRGYARLKFSNVLEGVRTEWDVKKTTAYDHIQPLFELLVEECHRQEGYADSALKSVTQ